jgi:hypothetical protein
VYGFKAVQPSSVFILERKIERRKKYNTWYCKFLCGTLLDSKIALCYVLNRLSLALANGADSRVGGAVRKGRLLCVISSRSIVIKFCKAQLIRVGVRSHHDMMIELFTSTERDHDFAVEYIYVCRRALN